MRYRRRPRRNEAGLPPADIPISETGAEIRRRRTLRRSLLAAASVLAIVAGLATVPSAVAGGSAPLAGDRFERSSSDGWGSAANGQRWMHPAGRGGFSVTGGAGLMRQGSAARPRVAMLNLDVRNVAVAFTLSLEGGSVGPSDKANAVARKSAAGEYRFGVRIGNGGQVRLSIAKSRPGGRASTLGRSVVVKGWRYRAGDRIRVLAQAIERDPTRLRMKVWRVGTPLPSRWQLVRTDRGSDITSAGRVGLMAVPAGGAGSSVSLRFDDVVVRRAASARKDPPASAPPPAQRPAPDPVPKSKNTITVPSSIDASGRTDVSSKLQAVINGAPDGATIVFKRDGRYKLGQALRISGRRDLTLEGNGARLDLPRTFDGGNSIGIQVRSGSVGTTIRGLTMVGNNPEAGTSDACCGREAQHAIAVLSANDTLIEDMDIRRTWGDCVYVNAATVPGGAWSDGVTFRDSTCSLSGRHGVGIIRAKDVRIVNNRFDQIGFMVVDIEPGAADAGADGVVFRGNDVGTYGLTDYDNSWLLAACGKAGADVRNVTVRDNTVEGNRIGWSGNITRPWRALSLWVCGDNAPRANFVVTDNVARNAVSGPALHFTSVKGLTVTGNRQPLRSGRLVSCTRCREATIR